MKISSNSWKSYIKNLSKIDKKAAETVSNYYREHPDLSVEQLISYCLAVSDYYGSAVGELACEMYEELAAASGRLVPTPEPAPTATYGEMAKTVQGVLAQSQNPDAVGAAVGRKVKTVGLDTILKNSLRDGAQFAWIPSGDTCAFCMMLASNGWQRASKKALKNGHASHVHNNCDCSYAVRFDDNTEVEGYDPDYYKDIYDNAEGDTWEQKTNYLRRKNYAANKDKINAQRRLNYAENKAKEAQKELIKKYGNAENIMLLGSDDELQRWAELAKQTGLSDKEIQKIIYKDAVNWEGILKNQTSKQLEKFTDQLFDIATEEEIGALRLWTGSAYGNINSYERYGTHVDEISRKAAKNIENVLAKTSTPEELIVKRGTGTKHMFENMPKGWKEDPTLLVGKKYSDKGFVATSPFENGGFSGSGDSQAIMYIRVPKGAQGVYIESLSHVEAERELLLQKGYEYRIIKAEYRPNQYFPDEKDLFIWAEVVLND